MTFIAGDVPHNRYELDNEEIKRMYLSGMSANKIARHFGVSDCPIYRRLERMGITRNNSESHKGMNAKENNPNWKGGRHKEKTGYIRVMDDTGKETREHRIVAEQKIGRKLKPGEVVHHINGDRSDNRPENLEVLESQSIHMKLHMDSEEARRRGRNGGYRKRAALLTTIQGESNNA